MREEQYFRCGPLGAGGAECAPDPRAEGGGYDFSGSETRREKNGAEVTLVLDNSGRELPLDTAEVAITRRLLRNGDSDFYLNKRSCRLKDIQELLAPTGLGKGSMAIIGQNRVDQVLTAHADERRVIFEDVAGISLYRMRKTEGPESSRRRRRIWSA